MELLERDRSSDLNAAHRDRDVREVVQAFLRSRHPGMVRLLKETLYGNVFPGPRAKRALVMNANLPNDVQPDASELVDAAFRVAAKDDPHRGYCHGAILEAVTAGLLRNRSALVREEVAVGPMPRWYGSDYCEPIDVLVDEPAIEFYECKTSATDIRGHHVTRFREVYDLATEDDRTPLTAFVTLSRASSVVAALDDIELERPLFGVTEDDLVALADGLPIVRLD